MARSAIERSFEIVSAKFSPEAMRLAFIGVARRGILEFQSRQKELIPFVIEVNGAEVSSEDAVGLGPATISYRLQRLPQVGRYAVNIAKQISPVDSGEYRAAWFLLADNAEVSENLIPPNVEELMLVNDVPYARKINVRGAGIQGVPPGIVERVRQFVLRRFGGFVTAEIEFHTLRGGYILKTSTKRHHAGEEMSYPSIVMRRKV